jgi:hypothetical protein
MNGWQAKKKSVGYFSEWDKNSTLLKIRKKIPTRKKKENEKQKKIIIIVCLQTIDIPPTTRSVVGMCVRGVVFLGVHVRKRKKSFVGGSGKSVRVEAFFYVLRKKTIFCGQAGKS